MNKIKRHNSKTVKKCALYEREEELKDSHIIPKFFYKYLKHDAGNVSFYSAEKNCRDGYRISLLCHDTEE